MKEYKFEYADQALIIKLLTICFTTALLLIASALFTRQYFSSTINLIIGIIIPGVIFFKNVKRIKLHGTAFINDDSIDFNTKNLNEKIHFKNLTKYGVYTFGGIKLKMHLHDGRKLEIFANEGFCNPKPFRVFCSDLVEKLESINALV